MVREHHVENSISSYTYIYRDLDRFQKTGKRSEIFLATKFGFKTPAGGSPTLCATPEYAKQSLEKSLKRLQTDYIDLWYLHR